MAPEQVYVRNGEGVVQITDDGVFETTYWNLGRAAYAGLMCPHILRTEDPDEAPYYLNWQVRGQQHAKGLCTSATCSCII